MSVPAQSVHAHVSRPFIFNVQDSNSIWQKIVIHESVVTLYYRILRGKAGQEQDEALFSVAPTNFNYIFDQQEEHQGLHAHSFEDSLLLHRHLKLQSPISIAVLQGIIKVFRQLEPSCALYGKYEIGTYVFLKPEEEALLLQQYSAHLDLNGNTNDSKLLSKDLSRLALQLSDTSICPASTSHGSNADFTPQFKIMPHAKPSKEAGLLQHFANKFGSEFMKKHGSALKIENVGIDQYIVSIVLPLSEKGKEWFLKKDQSCRFETLEGGNIKVTIPANVLSSDGVHHLMMQMEALMGGKNFALRAGK